MWQDDHVKAILAGALHSKDGQASQEAMAVLSLLAAHGLVSYRTLVVDAPQRSAASMHTSVEGDGGACRFLPPSCRVHPCSPAQ
jgi:hypothetical protein